MTYAACAMHDDCLAERKFEHTALRALAHAATTTDALLQIDVRMEQPGFMASLSLRLRALGDHARVVAQQRSASNQSSDADGHDDRRSEPGEPGHGTDTCDKDRAVRRKSSE
jgi:hypothetical protein